MKTMQSELARLSAVLGIHMMPTHEDRYELSRPLVESLYGLGCVCHLVADSDPDICECESRTHLEQSASFVDLRSIKQAVVHEVGSSGMTLAEYDAWFDESERAEYEAAPAYRVRSAGAPAVDFGYAELDDDEYDAYMQEVA